MTRRFVLGGGQKKARGCGEGRKPTEENTPEQKTEKQIETSKMAMTFCNNGRG